MWSKKRKIRIIVLFWDEREWKSERERLHVLVLINSSLRVATADLTKRLVLVTASLLVLKVIRK